MISMPNEYKQSMASNLRNQSYLVVTIGVINQVAQKSAAFVEEQGAQYSYLSNLSNPLDNYDVSYRYVSMEQDWYRADGTMIFPPRPEAVDFLLNNGVISEDILGPICIRFNAAYDIRGLTIDWGPNYPVDFTVTNGSKTAEITGNTLSYWTSEEIFDGTEYLLITPQTMVNGQGRLRIQKIFMGVGISFENKKILRSSKTEYVSPITEELPTIDFSLTIENRDRLFDVENKTSVIHYLEVGQDVTTRYGYTLPSGKITWIDGCVCRLSDWEANDESMSLSAEDKIGNLTETYYGGKYYADGISLYDLAVDVFTDAGLDEREYFLDEYLQTVIVHNPLPCETHKECLQLIANAGRCRLFQDRLGVICIEAAFVTVISPERMKVTSDDATEWSDLPSVIKGSAKYEYVTLSQNHYRVDGTMYFLPRSGSFLPAGFASQAVADADGNFTSNPKITITLEAATKYYSLQLNFASNPAPGVTIHTYYEDEIQESYAVPEIAEKENLIEHEFPLFDTIVFEFTKAQPNSRVFVDSVVFGDVTDYYMNYKVMTESPNGFQDEKVARVDVIQSIYGLSNDTQTIFQEIIDITDFSTYTFYFSEASYDVTAKADGTDLSILDSSAWFVTVDTSSITGTHEMIVAGKAYSIMNKVFSKTLNTTGVIEEWENPLIDETDIAKLQADWIGNYFLNNVEYDITYRGEPRLDAGDIVFLENKYVENLQIQIYEHTLNFNSGALSGSVKARRAVNQRSEEVARWREKKMQATKKADSAGL